MRKVVSILVIVMFIVAMAVPLYAGAGDKFKGGAEMFIKSPLTVGDSIKEEYEASEFKPFGVLGGLMKGVFLGLKDLGHGLFDMVTFPVDFK